MLKKITKIITLVLMAVFTLSIVHISVYAASVPSAPTGLSVVSNAGIKPTVRSLVGREYFNKVYDYVKDFRDFNLNDKAMFVSILGYLDVMQGKIDSAKARLDEIKFLLPNLPERYYWKEQTNITYRMFQMEVMVAEGYYKNAIAIGKDLIFKEVPDMNPKALWFVNIPSLQDVLARAYFQTGELDKAITEYEKLITFDQKSKDRRLIHPKYHYRIAKLYQEKGWIDKAINEYEKCIEIWKDADDGLPELVDAKKRLANLTKGN